MHVLKLVVSAILATTALPALSQQPTPSGGMAVKSSEPGKVTMADAVRVVATVTAIDKAKRIVTLKGPEGRTIDVVAGPEVKNFNQIKVGDELIVRYVEALTLELKKGGGGVRERTESGGAAAAKAGAKPGMAAEHTVKVTADVIAIDAAKQIVTLKGPQRTVDLKVRDPEQFKLIKVGDQIEATYQEAVAISVEAAPKPAGAKK